VKVSAALDAGNLFDEGHCGCMPNHTAVTVMNPGKLQYCYWIDVLMILLHEWNHAIKGLVIMFVG
jgi:hypothetical protein